MIFAVGMCCKSLWGKDLRQTRPAILALSPCVVRVYGYSSGISLTIPTLPKPVGLAGTPRLPKAPGLPRLRIRPSHCGLFKLPMCLI